LDDRTQVARNAGVTRVGCELDSTAGDTGALKTIAVEPDLEGLLELLGGTLDFDQGAVVADFDDGQTVRLRPVGDRVHIRLVGRIGGLELVGGQILLIVRRAGIILLVDQFLEICFVLQCQTDDHGLHFIGVSVADELRLTHRRRRVSLERNRAREGVERVWGEEECKQSCEPGDHNRQSVFLAYAHWCFAP
jgi:hypothetical protein